MGWSRRYGNWIGAACLVLLAAGALSGTEEEPGPVLPAGTSSAEMTEVWESEKKKIALTFDDGPHPVYTEQVLQVLDQGNIPATFFLLGQNIEEHQDLVKEIDAKGHLIGNHTYHHVQVTSLPLDQACEEIQKTSDLIESLTGKGTEYVRPPFGTWSEGLEDRLNLMKATNSAVNRLTSLEPFFYAAIIYLLMTFVLTLIAGRLEKHFSRYDAKEEW